jgi:hypothetical protein
MWRRRVFGPTGWKLSLVFTMAIGLVLLTTTVVTGGHTRADRTSLAGGDCARSCCFTVRLRGRNSHQAQQNHLKQFYKSPNVSYPLLGFFKSTSWITSSSEKVSSVSRKQEFCEFLASKATSSIAKSASSALNSISHPLLFPPPPYLHGPPYLLGCYLTRPPK